MTVRSLVQSWLQGSMTDAEFALKCREQGKILDAMVDASHKSEGARAEAEARYNARREERLRNSYGVGKLYVSLDDQQRVVITDTADIPSQTAVMSEDQLVKVLAWVQTRRQRLREDRDVEAWFEAVDEMGM